ncbi:hypothetical protein PROFUN_05562 [Planoprotostelium fungivorum]|uniref:Uncharacterized protein n=1 Tax=Planoprotostelium fungivorum TaxID=1890364 RepID=A0A2P6N044_9EUKA|nr:hypothetical protein PROFUN_05562 [Planoprotostelium fungivorum]
MVVLFGRLTLNRHVKTLLRQVEGGPVLEHTTQIYGTGDEWCLENRTEESKSEEVASVSLEVPTMETAEKEEEKVAEEVKKAKKEKSKTYKSEHQRRSQVTNGL